MLSYRPGPAHRPAPAARGSACQTTSHESLADKPAPRTHGCARASCAPILSFCRSPPATVQSSLHSNWNASPGANTNGTNVPRPASCAASRWWRRHNRENAATRSYEPRLPSAARPQYICRRLRRCLRLFRPSVSKGQDSVFTWVKFRCKYPSKVRQFSVQLNSQALPNDRTPESTHSTSRRPNLYLITIIAIPSFQLPGPRRARKLGRASPE